MGLAAQHLPTVNKEVMRKGPVLNQQHALAFCKPVTDEEIYSGLRYVEDDKASRMDGYNALFYKKAWPKIGREVTKAIRRFFNTGKMHKAINCTSITLVPKKINPATVKEYRSIACCIVV